MISFNRLALIAAAICSWVKVRRSRQFLQIVQFPIVDVVALILRKPIEETLRCDDL